MLEIEFHDGRVLAQPDPATGALPPAAAAADPPRAKPAAKRAKPEPEGGQGSLF